MRHIALCSGLLIMLVSGFVGAARAEPERLIGSKFITVMQGNTLSGETSKGVAFNAYFLPGGSVTYDDAGGAKDTGTWRLDKAGDVCVVWRNLRQGREDCYRVTLEGRRLSWTGKSGGGSGILRGTIAEGFVTAQ